MEITISLSDVAFVTLVALRLTDKIQVPWVWVMAPLWIQALAVLGVVGMTLYSGRKPSEDQVAADMPSILLKRFRAKVF